MRIALADAGLEPAELGYINAHGTSTPPNDPAETTAIKTVFGEAAYRDPGQQHEVDDRPPDGRRRRRRGGGLRAGLETGMLPPTINHDQPDPECDLDYVPNTVARGPDRDRDEQRLRVRRHNATLVFRRWTDA